MRTVAFVAALAVTGVAHRSFDTTANVKRGELFIPKASQVRFATLGFDAIVADYYWLLALQVVGGDLQGLRRAVIGRLVDVVTTLDPWVGHPYRFAAVWLTDSLENVRQANRLLRRGVAYHPRDWRDRHYLGFNHFFYLGENARAADIIEGAIGLPKAPRYLAPLVAKLKLERDGLETAGAFLAGLAESTQDPFARAEYLKALDEVATERRARLLDQARAVYVKTFGRDIVRVEDLVSGAHPLLRKLPPAHPHFPSFGWEIDAETGEIVSSFYGARYRAREHWVDRARRERWGTQEPG